MWFTNKIPKNQIDSRLFEFKGAVQTCDLGIIKFSLKVLTEDFREFAKESTYYNEILNFNDNLTPYDRRRKLLYYSFENLLNSLKFRKDLILKEIIHMPHGFSCPRNTDLKNDDFQKYFGAIQLH